MNSDTRIILTTLAISIPLYVFNSIYGSNPVHMSELKSELTKQEQINGLTKKVQECEQKYQKCKEINGSYVININSKENRAHYK